MIRGQSNQANQDSDSSVVHCLLALGMPAARKATEWIKRLREKQKRAAISHFCGPPDLWVGDSLLLSHFCLPCGFCLLNDFAVEEMDGALGVLGEARIVGNHADGCAFAVQLL